MNYLFSCILFLFSLSVKSQEKYLIRAEITPDAYKITNIRQITQDPLGFLWIGTQDGLFRSGSRIIEKYTTAADEKHTLKTPDVRSIVFDTLNSTAWISCNSGGLTAINLYTGEIEYSTLLYDKERVISVTRICNSLEKIYLASSSGVFTINKRNRQLKKIEGIDPINVYNILMYDDKLIVFTQTEGIILYDVSKAKVIQRIATSDFTKINDIRYYEVIKSIDGFFVATTDGIKSFKFSENKILYDSTVFNFLPSYLNRITFGVCVDRQQNVWYSTENNLIKVNITAKKYYIIKNAVANKISGWLSSVYTLFCDKDNNIWMGCQQGLAYLKNSPPFIESITSKEDAATNTITQAYYLNPLNDSIVIVCAENGLYNINTASAQINAISTGTSYDYYYKDTQIGTLVSNNQGLFSIQKKLFVPFEAVYPEFKKVGTLRINSLVRLGHKYIFGTENYKGVIIWDFEKRTIKHLDGSNHITFKEPIINAVIPVSNNQVAVLGDTYFNILNVESFQNTAYTYTKDNHSNYSIFFDLAKVKNTYYLGCYGSGIIVLDSNYKLINEISSKNGLSNNDVYKLFAWHDSLLFVTTNNGLNCLDVLNGRVKTFYQTDGLHDNVFEETSGNTFNNSIYAGGKNGLSIIKPLNLFEQITPPNVFFCKLNIELSNNTSSDTFNLNSKTYSISNKTIQTTISFIGINYYNPERTTYQYRILEQSSNWINLNNQNFITLIGLSPGTYHLQVKAANEDGVWSEPKELILIFLPKWYQTWWFYALIALTVAAILYALYRYRISQIKKQHEIRKNIATDLHDDLGSTLNSVKVFTNLAISGVKQEESLQQVKDNLTEATMSLRDMIWVLDDSMDTVDELVTRLKQFAIPVTAASNMEFIITAGSDVNTRTLTKEEKRNLFLICKEAINNSIKYSGATQITLAIIPAGKKIQITVSDNGKGFDEATVKKGYGLKNMQYRAGQIKYVITLVSTLQKGTAIKVLPQ